MKSLCLVLPLLCGCSLLKVADNLEEVRAANAELNTRLVKMQAELASSEKTPEQIQLEMLDAQAKRQALVSEAVDKAKENTDAAMAQAQATGMTLEKALGGSGVMTLLGMAGLHAYRNRTRRKALNGSQST